MGSGGVGLMPKPVRRIVTGHTPEGRSTVILDEPAPLVTSGATPEAGSTVLWVTRSAPASIAGEEDAAPAGVSEPVPLPGRCGTLLRVVDFAPNRRADSSATATLDYAVVLEGEIWAVLDEAETLMKAGDVLIQRGTSHIWDNRSDHLSRVLFVLIDAAPV